MNNYYDEKYSSGHDRIMRKNEHSVDMGDGRFLYVRIVIPEDSELSSLVEVEASDTNRVVWLFFDDPLLALSWRNMLVKGQHAPYIMAESLYWS